MVREIWRRRSVRQYLDKKVEPEKIESIIAAGMQAPSACNFQPWEFVVVRDRNIIEELSKVGQYTKPAAAGDTCIVPLANTDRVARVPLYFQQDMGACIENMLLQAVAEDLGTVWMGIYPDGERTEKVQKILDLPANLLPIALIAVGYPSEEPKEVDRFDASRIYYEKYNK